MARNRVGLVDDDNLVHGALKRLDNEQSFRVEDPESLERSMAQWRSSQAVTMDFDFCLECTQRMYSHPVCKCDRGLASSRSYLCRAPINLEGMTNGIHLNFLRAATQS